MAIAGRGLNAAWVLWGVIKLDGSSHVVTAQLVKSSDPNLRRSVTFKYSSPKEVSAAWRKLSNTTD